MPIFLAVRILDFKKPRNRFLIFRAALHWSVAKAIVHQASAFTPV